MDYIEPALATNSLEHLQALLCLAVYSIRSPFGVNLWYVELKFIITSRYHSCVNKNALIGKLPAWLFAIVLSLDITGARINSTGTSIH